MWISERKWNGLLRELGNISLHQGAILRRLASLQEGMSLIRGTQRTLIQMASREEDLTNELLAGLDATTTELDALNTVIDNLVTAVGNSSDVSPSVQAALDKVTEHKARIVAMALKGTPSEPQVPQE